MTNPASPDRHQRDHPHTRTARSRDYFTEVPVHVGILHANAETLELLHDFFSDTDPVIRTYLGGYLIARHPDEDTGDPGMEAILLVHELSEAAELLHTLAGDRGDGPST